EVFEEANGFDEAFRHPGGEDPDLSFRVRAAGHALAYVPEAVVYHAGIESYRDFVLHMFRRGVGEARAGRQAGRGRRVALRAALFPLYVARPGAMCWRTTAGKGGVPLRLAWLGLDAVGRLAFVAGSVDGLVRGR